MQQTIEQETQETTDAELRELREWNVSHSAYATQESDGWYIRGAATDYALVGPFSSERDALKNWVARFQGQKEEWARELEALRASAMEKGYRLSTERGNWYLHGHRRSGLYNTERQALEAIPEIEEQQRQQEDAERLAAAEKEEMARRAAECRVASANLPYTGVDVSALFAAQYYIENFGKAVRPGSSLADRVLCGPEEAGKRAASGIGEAVARAGWSVKYMDIADAIDAHRKNESRSLLGIDLLVLNLAAKKSDVFEMAELITMAPEVNAFLISRWQWGISHGSGVPTVLVTPFTQEQLRRWLGEAGFQQLMQRALLQHLSAA